MKHHFLLVAILLALAAPLSYAQQDSVAMHLGINDVVVTSKRDIISRPDMGGNISLSVDALNDMPRLGGAVDVIKLLQYTPGVAATQEGNTAMYVRGGDAGQSLVLLDGAPLYSPSHMLGFFSVLNTPHLSGLTLYKSGIPAEYGSSTSAITAIRTRRYMAKEFGIEANIGLIESDAAVELPIGKHLTLFASARHSYTQWLTSLLSDNTAIDYDFGDYGLGLVADLGSAGELSFNTHFNNDDAKADVFIYNSICTLRWWNALSTLSLRSELSPRTTMSNTLYGSIYDNRLNLAIATTNSHVRAGVADYGFKSVTNINLTDVTIDVGINYAYRRVRPQDIMLDTPNNRDSQHIENSSEAALFGSIHWPLHEHINIKAGLRLSLFANDHVWFYPEPRITVEVPVSSALRFWASYNFMTQYLQLVPQSNMSFATDFYLLSSEHTPPQLSHNLSLGYIHEALDGRLRWSAEAYYRYMLNVIEYDSRILEVIAGGTNHEAMLHSGRGESYGLETSIGYSDRTVDLHLNYTLSRSLRQFDAINGGNPFPANSDRKHNISLLTSYKPSSHWTLSATFVYATGAPYTATTALYIGGNAFLREYGPYNGSKLPDLHHLDISATYWFHSRHFERSGLNISIYNVYARRNPLMVSWSIEDNGTDKLYLRERHHIIYTIIPSISWTVKF